MKVGPWRRSDACRQPPRIAARAVGYAATQGAACVALSVDRLGNYRRFMKITNIGAGDGLEPLQWEAVQERLNAGEPPGVGAPNQRTT